MNSNENRNRLVPGPTHFIPTVVFNASGGRTVGPNTPRLIPGPTNVLPETVVNLAPPPTEPALNMTFFIRHGVASTAVAFDLMTAFADLNRLEVSLGGQGLKTDESRSELSPTNGVVRLVLLSACQTGAADRLKAVAQAVNSREQSTIPTRSFLSCEADVLAV